VSLSLVFIDLGELGMPLKTEFLSYGLGAASTFY
jgi:hypothetical protein